MRYQPVLLLIFSFLFFNACKKEENLNSESSFIKTITGNYDVFVIGSVQLSDNNYLVVSSAVNKTDPGTMVKLNAAGNVLWKKEVSPLTNTIFDVFLLPGEDYAILGHQTEDTENKNLTICIYSKDGELKATKLLPTGFPNYWKAPYEVLQLSNGNFAFAGTSVITPWGYDAYGYLILTNGNLDVLSTRSFNVPPSSIFTGCEFRGICETTQGEIMITGSTSLKYTTFESTDSYNLLVRTDLNGVKKSFNIFADSGYTEKPNCLIHFKDGALGVSARFSSTYNIDGTYVNYLNTTIDYQQSVSGRISLCTYDVNGQLTGRKEFSDYLYNGQLSSIKQTSDGGYILCGTVGQANSSLLVSPAKIFLLKIDANLNTQWSKSIPTVYPSYGGDVIQMSDGGFLVSGYQRSFNDKYDAIVIRTDENGNY